jgi:hypothetical protein
MVRSDSEGAAVRRRLLFAALVAMASGALDAAAAVGMVRTVHFVKLDLVADLPADLGLLLCAILPLVAGAVMVSARGNQPPAQQNSLSLAGVLLAAAIPASLIAGFVTAFIVA